MEYHRGRCKNTVKSFASYSCSRTKPPIIKSAHPNNRRQALRCASASGPGTFRRFRRALFAGCPLQPATIAAFQVRDAPALTTYATTLARSQSALYMLNELLFDFNVLNTHCRNGLIQVMLLLKTTS